MSKKIKILIVSPEISPYAKTGGLGDVSNALPKALIKIQEDVSLAMPFYSFIKKQAIKTEKISEDEIKIGKNKYPVIFFKTWFQPDCPLYLIYNKDFFDRKNMYGEKDDNLRFLFFNKAILKLIKKSNLDPDLIHCHDWQSGLIPNFIKKSKNKKLQNIATLYTIHNLPFQFQQDWWKVSKKNKDHGRGLPKTKDKRKIKYINFARRAIKNADIINTVSQRYAKEILTHKFAQGLDRALKERKKDIYGIINGIDYTVFNPAFDKNITYNYDWNSLDKKKKNKIVLQKEVGLEKKPETPIIGLVHRLTEQKGFDLILQIIEYLLKLNLQIVVVGSGNKDYIKSFKKLSRKKPKKIAIYAPFTEKMASRVYAGSDMFLMPSRYEPCGISQLISMRYGSIPIVHETGGLSDTITNYNPRTAKGNGFKFSRYSKEDLLMAIVRALENFKHRKSWEHLTWQAMRLSFSWELPAKKYLALYRRAVRKHKKAKK